MERRDRHNNSESTTYLNRSHPPRPQNMHRAPPPPFSVIPPPKKRGDHHALFFSANATFFFFTPADHPPLFFRQCSTFPLFSFTYKHDTTVCTFCKKNTLAQKPPCTRADSLFESSNDMLRTYIERRRRGEEGGGDGFPRCWEEGKGSGFDRFPIHLGYVCMYGRNYFFYMASSLGTQRQEYVISLVCGGRKERER